MMKPKKQRARALEPSVIGKLVIAIASATIVLTFSCVALPQERTNVILIMTDDQGIGDFGVMGNGAIKTPNIDAMAGRSASMTNFYVSPVCSPTRASLMAGRYNYRTRCIDTWMGRSMLEPDEVTIAEILSDAGYRTGIFGKWHLGDCYPMRPVDQGFDESLVHRGGGLAQPSEPRENQNRYTNAILFNNGNPVRTEGYCTDVYFDAAIKFIESSQQAKQNFFTYIATNAPHGPFHDVPEDLRADYLKRSDELRQIIRGEPRDLESAIDRLARIAAMITNIDQNVGRLFDKLDELGLTEDTLVIFLVDNGPNSERFAGGLRGRKSDVYEGGIRSPLWMHWPSRLAAGYQRGEPAAHIDLMPTILDACEIPQPAGLKLDGRSVLPILEGKDVSWSPRHIVIQAHRGDVPQRYHHFMIRDSRWKLLHPSGFGRARFEGRPEFELYDLSLDPDESDNIAGRHPDVVDHLKSAYDLWFDDVSSTRRDNFAPPRIHIGSPQERLTVLTRQDWRGSGWGASGMGHWEVHVETEDSYNIRLDFDELESDTNARLVVGKAIAEKEFPSGATQAEFSLQLKPGPCKLYCQLESPEKTVGPYQVFVSRATDQPSKND